MIRGGQTTLNVHFAMGVDELGSLTSGMFPGGIMKGIGDSTVLVASSCCVVVVIEHTTRKGQPTILRSVLCLSQESG
jgi:3-oxoacid CoA-transferase subunit B